MSHSEIKENSAFSLCKNNRMFYINTMTQNCFFSEVLGNSQMLDGGAMFGNAPRPVWQKWIPPDELGRIPLACRALLIEYKGQKILCEAGIGSFFEPKMAERFGVQTPEVHQLRESLKKLNIKPEDIDTVVLSHLHFDHAGGILPTFQEISQGNNDLLFKNARYIVGKEAFARAENPHSRDRASFIPGLTEKLNKSKELILFDGTETFFDNRMSFFITHGHTPGQLHTVFQGDEFQVIFCGDLIPGSPWVHLPITMGYDRFPEMLIDEKQKLYESVDLTKTYFFFTHDNQISAAQLAKDTQGKYGVRESLTHAKKVTF